MLMSFGVNWMGHYVLENTYLPFQSLVSSKTFMLCIGCGLGTVLLVVGIINGLKKDRKVKTRFEMAVLCYFASALIAFSIM